MLNLFILHIYSTALHSPLTFCNWDIWVKIFLCKMNLQLCLVLWPVITWLLVLLRPILYYPYVYNNIHTANINTKSCMHFCFFAMFHSASLLTNHPYIYCLSLSRSLGAETYPISVHPGWVTILIQGQNVEADIKIIITYLEHTVYCWTWNFLSECSTTIPTIHAGLWLSCSSVYFCIFLTRAMFNVLFHLFAQ